MEKKKITDTVTVVYEYEIADNGAILAEPALRSVEITDATRGGMEYQLGKNILSEIKNYMDNRSATAVKLTLNIQEIEPKY